MITPNLGLEQIPANSLQNGAAVNDALQVLDAVVQLSVQDKDATAPPATVAGDVGKRWIIAAGASGAWLGRDGQIALCVGAGAWQFLVPAEGWRADVRDEGIAYRYSGTEWEPMAVDVPDESITAEKLAPDVLAMLGGVAQVATISTATHNLAAADMGRYNRTTYAGAAAVTVRPDSVEAIDASAEAHFRAVGGALTLTAGSGVTLHPPAGGTLVVPQGGTVTIKKVGTDEWDVIGATEEAP